jgi:hypothetical protein
MFVFVALTLAEATQLRADFYQALRAVASGKSYSIGTRTLTRADEKWIEQQFQKYDRMVDELAAGQAPGGVRAIRAVPRDL